MIRASSAQIADGLLSETATIEIYAIIRGRLSLGWSKFLLGSPALSQGLRTVRPSDSRDRRATKLITAKALESQPPLDNVEPVLVVVSRVFGANNIVRPTTEKQQLLVADYKNRVISTMSSSRAASELPGCVFATLISAGERWGGRMQLD